MIEPTDQYKQSIVKIFDQKEKVIGTGCCINGGYILTCAHVVTQSLGLGKKPAEITVDQVKEKTIQVQFHFAPAAQSPISTEIIPAFWQFRGEDVALLRLIQGPVQPPIMPLQPHAAPWGHEFSVFGFPDKRPEGWSEGKIINEQSNTRVQVQGVGEQGLEILPGFSGAPVWDKALGGVVGMVASRDPEEGAKIGFMVSHNVLQQLVAALEVVTLLAPFAQRLEAHWRNAYRLVQPQNSEFPPPTSLEQAILQLLDLPHQTLQAQSYRRIDIFLASLSLRESGLGVVETWLQQQPSIPNYAALITAVQENQDLQAQEQQKTVCPYLLCLMQRQSGGDRYLVQAYLVPALDCYDADTGAGVKPLKNYHVLASAEGDNFTQNQLTAVVQSCLDEVARELPDIRALKVEIFLSLEDLGLAVDCWPISQAPGAEWLGGRYQVVLRLVERWQSGYIQFNGDWEDKWHTLTTQTWDQPGYDPATASSPLVCGDCKKPKKIRRELREANCVGLVLNTPPETYDPNSFGPFQAILESGAPIALWPRQPIEEAEITLLDLLQNPIRTLLDQVREQRQEAEDESDDDEDDCYLGQHLGLLWENPKIVPPFARVPNTQSRLRSA